MSGAGLSYGLNFTKKTPFGARPPPGKRKPIFDEDLDDDDGSEEAGAKVETIEEIGEFGGIDTPSQAASTSKPSKKNDIPPPSGLSKKANRISQYGDLSSTFTSKKHAATAEELDASIYDYDAVYDSLKPAKKATSVDAERKPKYMSNLLQAAAIRKRDAQLAEEKRLAREREQEGDEFADKEKFVTSAYKKQQEENRRLEEEEKKREEEEAKKNKGRGMTSFYKDLLAQDERRHAEVVAAAEEAAKAGPSIVDGEDEKKEKTEAEIAREINEKTGKEAISVNDEGQVVDKRQLLKGGLNIVPKAKPVPSAAERDRADRAAAEARARASGPVGAGGGRQAQRERQTRMLEAQLEQATKRALEDEEVEREKVERAAKTRKTEGEIMSAKERYLQRKKEAEEAKKKGEAPT